MTDKVQPIFIMSEGSQRNSGKTAQRNNIMAAKLVAETIRTTLGPKGMDKMLVDSMGDIVITNDGVTILDEMQIGSLAQGVDTRWQQWIRARVVQLLVQPQH